MFTGTKPTYPAKITTPPESTKHDIKTTPAPSPKPDTPPAKTTSKPAPSTKNRGMLNYVE